MKDEEHAIIRNEYRPNIVQEMRSNLLHWSREFTETSRQSKGLAQLRRNKRCSKINDILTAMIADPLLNRNLSPPGQLLARNTGS